MKQELINLRNELIECIDKLTESKKFLENIRNNNKELLLGYKFLESLKEYIHLYYDFDLFKNTKSFKINGIEASVTCSDKSIRISFINNFKYKGIKITEEEIIFTNDFSNSSICSMSDISYEISLFSITKNQELFIKTIESVIKKGFELNKKYYSKCTEENEAMILYLQNILIKRGA